MVHTWSLFYRKHSKTRQDQASVAYPLGFLHTKLALYGEKHKCIQCQDNKMEYAGGRGWMQFVDMKTKKCKEQTESEDIIAAHIFICLAIYIHLRRKHQLILLICSPKYIMLEVFTCKYMGPLLSTF